MAVFRPVSWLIDTTVEPTKKDPSHRKTEASEDVHGMVNFLVLSMRNLLNGWLNFHLHVYVAFDYI